ncbi:MAG: Fe-S cluster assembly ATPase SufC [Puniceicoccales bacterium]|jgi:Fe-S cluster assembly ATP-binding protein|nr:Fe-S cluster assembly ATPase SufC [Puniceicoccales bacterium]
MKALEIKHLKVSICGKVVLEDFSLRIAPGEMHAFLGKNGVGKTSLAKVIAGDPNYEILDGDILMDGESIIGKRPDEIARLGFFLAFQNPVEIPGVSVANFIRAAMRAKLPKEAPFSAVDFYKELYAKMEILHMDRAFSSRSLNDGFSGGEKKRCEILQMMMLEPRYAIFDETDSGLDVDAIKIVASAVNNMRSENFSALIITHHSKLLEQLRPDFVHILSAGKIAASGSMELVENLEKFGYDFFREGEGA